MSNIPTTQNLNAVAVSSSGKAWVVGAAGALLKGTLNTGSGAWSWVQDSPAGTSIDFTTVNWTSVATADGAEAWAIGTTGAGKTVLIHTAAVAANGTDVWTLQAPGTNNIAAIAAVDPNDAWIVGAQGTILKTATAGAVPALPH
jgi:hypothetical protein